MRVGKVRLKWKLQSEVGRFPRQSNNYANNKMNSSFTLFKNREMYCNNLDLICQLHIVDTRLIDPGNAVFVAAEGNQLVTTPEIFC